MHASSLVGSVEVVDLFFAVAAVLAPPVCMFHLVSDLALLHNFQLGQGQISTLVHAGNQWFVMVATEM